MATIRSGWKSQGMLSVSYLFMLVLVVLEVAALAAQPQSGISTAPATAPASSPASRPHARPTDNINGLYDIPKMEGITIDGQLADWKDGGFRIESLCQLINWRGDRIKDHNAVRLGWDDRGLLVLVEVQDATPSESACLQQLADFDSVDIYATPVRDGTRPWHVLLAPGNGRDQKLRAEAFDYLGVIDSKTPVQNANPKKDFTAASAVTKGGYIIETLVPWKNLGIEPKLGREIAFQIWVNDHDGTTSSKTAWYPSELGRLDSTYMMALKLADKPSAPVAASRRVTPVAKSNRVARLEFVNAKTGAPLDDVMIDLMYSVRNRHCFPCQSTDDVGVSVIEFPDGVNSIDAYLHCQGFVPVELSLDLQKQLQDDSTLVIQMEPGTPIGGTIVDEAGKPVAGAVVGFGYAGGGEECSVDLAGELTRTDKNGKWRYDGAPADVDESLAIVLLHNDHISDRWVNKFWWGPSRDSSYYPRPSLADLQQLAGKVVMAKGVAPRGQIVDDQGKAVPGAKIQYVDEPYYSLQIFGSDAQGRFKLLRTAAQTVDVMVTCKGFEACRGSINAEENAEPTVITLTRTAAGAGQ